ncbi:prepilin peptidase [Naasia sp. SYSU D00948]|uniref:prepilin peptidase n=1 Tax=Naasia sp. SYSU D00948 TaxID=2817379 RepID=UPI001FF06EEC|nr:prepilin peptidase [Naasia sp. SYSU D00948]
MRAAVLVREERPWRPGLLAWQAPVAIVLLAVGVAGAPPLLLPAVAWLAVTTPELVRVDLAEHRLPDRLTLPGYPLALAGIAAAASAGVPAVPAVLAGAAYLALFLLLSAGGGMGMGDVKLAGVLGLVLGAVGVAASLGALLLAFVAGGCVAIVMLARAGRTARVAFGPFLLGGFWASLLLLS